MTENNLLEILDLLAGLPINAFIIWLWYNERKERIKCQQNRIDELKE